MKLNLDNETFELNADDMAKMKDTIQRILNGEKVRRLWVFGKKVPKRKYKTNGITLAAGRTHNINSKRALCGLLAAIETDTDFSWGIQYDDDASVMESVMPNG